MKWFLLFIFLFTATISNAQELIPYHGKKGWGYADTSGKVVIKPNKDSVNEPFWPDGKDIVLQNGKAVFVNSKGWGSYYVSPAGFEMRLDKKTQIRSFILHSPWNKGNDSIYNWADLSYSYTSQSGYFVVGNYAYGITKERGLIDSTGKIIIPLKYNDVYYGEKFIGVDSANYFGEYTYDGKEIIPAIYKDIYLNEQSQFICMNKLDGVGFRHYAAQTDLRDSLGKFLFSIKGTYLFSPSYPGMIASDCDSFRFYDKSGKFIFSMDTTGKFLGEITDRYIQFVKFKWSNWDRFTFAFELYSHDGKFIRSDSAEQEILLYNGSVLVRKVDRKFVYPKFYLTQVHYLLVDANGNKIKNIAADTVEEYSDREEPKKTLTFKYDEKFGWMSKYDGHIMLPALYDLETWKYDSLYEDYIKCFSARISDENFVVATANGPYLMDTNNLVLAGPYEFIACANGIIYAEKNDSTFFLDSKGRLIKKIEGFPGFDEMYGVTDVWQIDGKHGHNLLRVSDMQMLLPCNVNSITRTRNLFYVEVFRYKNDVTYFDCKWYVDKNGHNFIDPELLKSIPE